MTGIVCIWPFTIATIPVGWLLCDGTHDTPDMRGYVAIGARDGFDAGAVLGSDTHVHAFDFVSGTNRVDHTHLYEGESFLIEAGSFDVGSVPGFWMEYSIHTHFFSGETSTESNHHDHDCVGDTVAGDSKQLSREILFIMKE